jgi:U3 small nucleolar RNA-associated protein 16
MNPLPATMSAPQKAPEVIEILSDSEPEDMVKDDLEDLPELLPEANDHDDQPLLRAAGIKYKTRDHDEEDDVEEDAEQEEDDQPDAPARSTVSPRVLRSGKRVTIDTTESKSSSRRTKSSSSARESEQHKAGETFKTTLERKHIKFDDAEQEAFVTPKEAPMENPFESIKPASQNGAGDESEEESDDEAPPEAVSTRVAEAESLKAAKAAAKAAEQYVKQSSYPPSSANYSLNQDKLRS